MLEQMKHLETFNELSEPQQKALLALLQYPTRTEAAKRAGIGRVTLYRWMQQPEFKEALSDARREIASVTTLRVIAISEKAVAALERALDCGDVGHEIRAAKEVLDRMDKKIEIEELLARIEAIEEDYR
jgi:phage terminase small subunit